MYVIKCWLKKDHVFYFVGKDGGHEDIVFEQKQARRFVSKSEAKRVFHQHMATMGVGTGAYQWKFRCVQLVPRKLQVGDKVTSDKCCGGTDVVYQILAVKDGVVTSVRVIKSPEASGIGAQYDGPFTCQFSRAPKGFIVGWKHMSDHWQNDKKDFFSVKDPLGFVFRQDADVFPSRTAARAALQKHAGTSWQTCCEIIPT